jgi:hypothetical protein
MLGYATLIIIASISVTLTKVGKASKDSVTVEGGLTIKKSILKNFKNLGPHS